MSTGHTQRVADFVAGFRFDRIPERSVHAAKDAILDAVGVALAGSREQAASICAEMARDEGAREEAAVFGQGFRTSSMGAAFANGVAVHALDYDSSFAIMGQPMAGLVPAVFALAEPLRATGRQLLEAYIVGFEVAARVARSMAGAGEGEWHATGTVGTLGCASAAARLLNLNAWQVANALGIATSMASGVTSNFGTMTKPLHAGLAARNGVHAANLAARGFTSGPATLEPGKGFFEAFASGLHDLAPFESLGSSFEVDQGVRVKAYPCGGLSHSAIDAVLALRAEHRFTADGIERIDAALTPYAASRIVFRIPETELQGKFSIPYLMARSVIDGALTPDTFTDEAIKDPAVLALAERVHMSADTSLESDGTGRRPAIVTVILKDGQTLTRRVDYPRGTPHTPLTADDLYEKFTACAGRVLSDDTTTRLMTGLVQLDTVENVADLSVLLLSGGTEVSTALR